MLGKRALRISVEKFLFRFVDFIIHWGTSIGYSGGLFCLLGCKEFIRKRGDIVSTGTQLRMSFGFSVHTVLTAFDSVPLSGHFVSMLGLNRSKFYIPNFGVCLTGQTSRFMWPCFYVGCTNNHGSNSIGVGLKNSDLRLSVNVT